jgi:hypothetical protein
MSQHSETDTKTNVSIKFVGLLICQTLSKLYVHSYNYLKKQLPQYFLCLLKNYKLHSFCMRVINLSFNFVKRNEMFHRNKQLPINALRALYGTLLLRTGGHICAEYVSSAIGITIQFPVCQFND